MQRGIANDELANSRLLIPRIKDKDLGLMLMDCLFKLSSFRRANENTFNQVPISSLKRLILTEVLQYLIDPNNLLKLH